MKKSHARRITAILLVFIMAMGMLSGCSGNTKGTEGSNADSVTPLENSESASTSSSDSTKATGEQGSSLPLTDEAITLKIWMPMDGNMGTVSSNYNDNAFFKEMEKRTGVHLEFITPATGEEQSSFNLMIASGELPDIISYAQLYTEGLDSAIEDDNFLDLTPYLDTYLYDYNQRRSVSETLMKNTTTDSGKVGAVYAIYEDEQGPWMGMQVRKDWLDDCGLDMPVTYADWEEMLTAFKEKKGAYAPLSLNKNGYMVLSDAMSAGYGSLFGFMNVEGKVQYGPITEGWYKYLKTMSDWYAKGLIDPDYMTSSAFFVDTEKVTSGQTGAWSSMYTMPAMYEATSTDKNMQITAIASPVEKEGDAVHIRCKSTTVNIPVAISANTEYPELCMKWLNYLFTEEGSILANYGIEGSTFEYDENGKPNYNSTITANTDGLSMSQAQSYFTCPPSMLSVYYDWKRELISVPKEDVTSYDIWGTADASYLMPASISLSSEESKENAALYSDIQTYVTENMNQFITGVKDIDKEWEDYVSSIEAMNIKRCIEIYQTALDRYNAR